MNSLIKDKKLVFICGLHRSGTSLLHDLLSAQADISGFSGTGVPKDEGQFLQTVYKQAYHYGGPGRFGFREEAALSEHSALATPQNAIKLFREWSQYWDLTKSVLVEKSPPNLIRTRFLQQLFPEAYFIILMRHPVAVAGATKKWSTSSRYSLFKHWLVCHQKFRNDAPGLHKVLCIRYEEMVAQPQKICLALSSFLNTDVQNQGKLFDVNQRYFDEWNARRNNPLKMIQTKWIELRLEKQLNAFGYSFEDV